MSAPLPTCEAAGCSQPATRIVEWHEAKPFVCDEHYVDEKGRVLTGKHSFYWRDEGRNDQGERVVSAACPCGWVHMTAYSRGRKQRAIRYLHGRWITHD